MKTLNSYPLIHIIEDQLVPVTGFALTVIKLCGSKSDQMPLPENIYALSLFLLVT